jgi:serine-type D-Ala-D-Ala carboxypeptidase/endopeptidase
MTLRRSGIAVLALALAAQLAVAQAGATSAAIALPSDSAIANILAQRLDALAGEEDGIGIVVGIIGPGGRRVIAYGHRSQRDSRELDGDTLFEIGSVGKVFTALLLADMVRKGEVALGDPVAKYLPSSATIPEYKGHAITLADLATHRSGLPFMPDEIPVLSESAARKYGAPQLYEFLARYKLTRAPGSDWDYSNLGYWLLGQALTARADMDFEKLVRTRITAPLQMNSTIVSLALPFKLKLRVAPGHDASLQPAPPSSALSVYSVMQPAGIGAVSSVNDMLTFLAVCLGYHQSPLAPSIALMLQTQRPIDDSSQALGWVVIGKGDDRIITHEGGTWGYASYIAWDPATRVGVVVLSNQITPVSDIALHLLRPNMPSDHPTAWKHTEIKLDSAALDAYAGDYEAEDIGVFKIAREHHLLSIEMPPDWGLPKLRLHPESRTDFFVTELPAHVTFQISGDGRVTGVLVYPPRGQRAIPAKRTTSTQ